MLAKFVAIRLYSTSPIMAQVQRAKHDIYPFISASHSLKDSAKGKVILVTGGGKGIGKVCESPYLTQNLATHL